MLNIDTVNADRIIPGWRGGKYTRDNIRPSCSPCGMKQGGQMSQELRREKLALKG